MATGSPRWGPDRDDSASPFFAAADTSLSSLSPLERVPTPAPPTFAAALPLPTGVAAAAVDAVEIDFESTAAFLDDFEADVSVVVRFCCAAALEGMTASMLPLSCALLLLLPDMALVEGGSEGAGILMLDPDVVKGIDSVAAFTALDLVAD